ncbi:MAG: lipoprotein-releasing ABC transporter permease subunit [Nitrospina sp.]|jgi:lipoprotein-releasing system permease protein|nr:lipoprotein-releasing ABC transporter permease subunit [Nitrospina sp.]MBT3511232.1 lipoprotein-releasing ABC transporter permease subunit [Nitrospina sp.]MBT3876428.1 lipoprotein-releasing ABC transporter permease subunit [Nitrospina sp.]MBT4047544.1 lipoprotein-releasing ABC transporter permease subunit [Nitrospina sp.]MBT4558099.1 lipoprotein-releasing ABC transporter permease subunit [Nitrospina sp.]
MSYELFVSLRQLKAKRTQRFISLNTWISIGGVALGVMALIVVIAVMSGFGKDLRDKILGTNSHVVVTNVTQTGMVDYETIMEKVVKVEGVKAAAPFILNQVMLAYGDNAVGVVVRGVDADREAGVSDLEKNLVQGSLKMLERPDKSSGKPRRDGIILGKELARRLGVQLEDAVSMVAPASRMTPMGLIPKIKLFLVVGFFESGMFEYDSNLAFISIHSAQKFFAMKGKVSGIEIRVVDIEQADQVAAGIQDSLGFPYFARDWMRMNKNLFSALRLEKIVMFIILILIILVAAFNIVSTLFMVVMEKTKEIAILKSMGASRSSIMKIFSFQGLIIGVTGTMIGCIGGFTVVPNLNEIVGLIENIFGITAFPSDVYYLDKLPSEIQYFDSFLIVVFSIIICFVASLYPAWRASRLDPVEGLRYE